MLHCSKNTTVQCCSTVFPLCLKRSVLTPVSWITSPSDWSAHTRLPQHHINNNRVAVLNQFLHAIHSVSVTSQSHRIIEGRTYEAFQEQCFLWDSRTSVGSDFGLFEGARICMQFLGKTFNQKRKIFIHWFFSCPNKLNKQTIFVVMTG